MLDVQEMELGSLGAERNVFHRSAGVRIELPRRGSFSRAATQLYSLFSPRTNQNNQAQLILI